MSKRITRIKNIDRIERAIERKETVKGRDMERAKQRVSKRSDTVLDRRAISAY